MIIIQSSYEQTICAYHLYCTGETIHEPGIGCKVHDFAFDTIDAALVGRVETGVRRVLTRWEPRIDIRSTDFDLPSINDGVLIVNIGYRLRATKQSRNPVFGSGTFQLECIRYEMVSQRTQEKGKELYSCVQVYCLLS